MKCPKCGKKATDVRHYPKWDREGKKRAKNYIHESHVVANLFNMVTESCLIVEEIPV